MVKAELPVWYSLIVAGLPEQLTVSRHELDTVHKPLLAELLSEATRRPGKRHIVFLAGPAGSGKSTLTALWQEIIPEINTASVPFQVLPMDGFHHPNNYLDAHTINRNGQTIPMQKIKGAPETFNLEEILKAVTSLESGKEMKWPIYDRKDVRDIVPDALEVIPHGLVVVEGNYILLNEPGWRDLRRCAYKSLFIDTPEERIANDIIQRHIAGGNRPEDARAHYLYSDRKNNDRIRAHLLPPDIRLTTSLTRRITMDRKS